MSPGPELTLFNGAEALVGALRIRPKVGFVEWAQREIRNGDGTRFRFLPYQLVPASGLFDPRITSTSLRWFTGAGKTYLFAIGMGYAVTQLKLECGTMFPAEKQSGRWFEKKLMPVLRATAAVRSVRMTKDNTLDKAWENGASIEGSGANSGGGLRTLELDLMNSEEIDAIKQDAGDEGDKLAQFEGRGRGRPRQYIWRSSYPSVRGQSNIDAELEQSDLCNWHFECPRCGKPSVFHTDHIVYPAGEPEMAEVECPLCAGTFPDADRKASSDETGHWLDRDGKLVEQGDIPAEKYGRNRGFHLGCMAYVGPHHANRRSFLHQVAAKLEKIEAAKNKEKARRVFVNTMDAESFEESVELKAEPTALVARREDYRPSEMLPDGVLLLTWGADVNKDFISAEIVGAGENGEEWGIAYETVHGSWMEPKTWRQLSKFVFQIFDHPLGIKLRARKGCLDTRYQTSTARKWCKANRGKGAVAVTGSNQLGVPLLNGKRKDPETRIPVWSIGTHEAKDQIYQHVEIEHDLESDEGFPHGYMHWPKIECYRERYFDGLLAEDSAMKKGAGGEFHRFFFRPPGAPRNEPLDCRVYARAARAILKPNFTAIRANLERRAAEGDEPKPQPQSSWRSGRKPYIIRPRKNWL